LEGLVTYILLYTVILKRRSRLNVIATAPSVAAPAWFGWYLGGSELHSLGFLIGFLVAIWGPLHLWSLALIYSKDYTIIKVPMLPSTLPIKEAILGINGALAALIISTYLIIPWTRSNFYLYTVTILNLILGVTGLRLQKSGLKKDAWWLFKLTAPYILIVLFSFMLDQLIPTH
jgi:protoheme IX farnesyltransferase